MDNILEYFKSNYYEGRAAFRKSLAEISRTWPEARLTSQSLNLPGVEDLTIDIIQAPAIRKQDKALILSTGEHGIEGLIGSTVLALFTNEYLPRLDPEDTGLLLIHAINPWGMQHLRRVNPANVDLNRNFLWDAKFFATKGAGYNADYARIYSYLNPRGRLKGGLAYTVKNISFLLQTIWNLLVYGQKMTYTAVLLGQYGFPQGIYYGGSEWAEETRTVMSLYRQTIADYNQIVHLDMHSGYGPRYQMSMVNSYLEPLSSQEMQADFAYPLVVKSNPAEFYSMQGDMIDFLYTLIQNEFPEKKYYGTSFEFGTYGDAALARLRALATMVFENQCHHFGSDDGGLRQSILDDFLELYYPSAADWRMKALVDTRQGFAGILKAYHYIE